MKMNSINFILLFVCSLLYSQTIAFRHDFNQSKNASYFTLGNNLTLVDSQFGESLNAIFLPQAHDKMSLNYSSVSSIDLAGSVSFWYKHVGGTGSLLGGNHPIFFTSNGASSYYERIVLAVNGSNGTLMFGGSRGNEGVNFTNISVASVPATYNMSNWNHYTITYEYGAMKLYVNGQHAATRNQYGATAGAEKIMHFGAYRSSATSAYTSSITGYFDNIKVFNGVLNASTVLDNYNDYLGSGNNSGSLFSHFFNGTKNATGFTLGSDLTLVQDQWNNTQNAINLNANHGKLKLDYTAHANVLQNTGTVAFWYRYGGYMGQGINANTHPIFYVPNGSSSYHEGMALSYNHTTSKLKFGTSSSPISTVSQDLGFTLQSNVWYYFTISYTADKVKLYVDGVEVVSRNFYGLQNATNVRLMHFGSWNPSNNASSDLASVMGDFDNIQVFGQAYTASQVSNLYQAEIAAQGMLNIDEVKQVKKGVEIAVYPNPVTDYLMVKSTQNIADIEVYNSVGQLQKVNQDGDRIDLSSASAGVYTVKVKLKNGDTKMVRVIKK